MKKIFFVSIFSFILCTKIFANHIGSVVYKDEKRIVISVITHPGLIDAGETNDLSEHYSVVSSHCAKYKKYYIKLQGGMFDDVAKKGLYKHFPSAQGMLVEFLCSNQKLSGRVYSISGKRFKVTSDTNFGKIRFDDKPKTVTKKPDPQKTKIVDDGKIIKIGSGTGFVISKLGHVISNNHVVGVCKKVMTVVDGKEIFLDILATDKVNDLGLIKGKVNTKMILSIKSDGAELGEEIVTFGYPLTQQLSDSVKLTKGIVSALSGMENNYSQIQIDAAIQPGNSGGPVLNMNGQVVGVASSGLSKLYMAKKTKYIPENVNFAVASPTLSNFLKANKINFSTSSSFRTLSTKDLAKIGKPATIQLFCMNTRTEYAKLKKAKTHNDMLLDLD